MMVDALAIAGQTMVAINVGQADTQAARQVSTTTAL